MKGDWKTIVNTLLLVLLLGTAVAYLIVLHNDLTAARKDIATLHDDAVALHNDASVFIDILEPWLPGN
jgi:amino acid permease